MASSRAIRILCPPCCSDTSPPPPARWQWQLCSGQWRVRARGAPCSTPSNRRAVRALCLHPVPLAWAHLACARDGGRARQHIPGAPQSCMGRPPSYVINATAHRYNCVACCMHDVDHLCCAESMELGRDSNASMSSTSTARGLLAEVVALLRPLEGSGDAQRVSDASDHPSLNAVQQRTSSMLYRLLTTVLPNLRQHVHTSLELHVWISLRCQHWAVCTLFTACQGLLQLMLRDVAAAME